MTDNKISCVLTEPNLKIFSENTSGRLQLKKKYILPQSIPGVLINPYPDPGRKQATATKTYSTIPDLRRTNNGNIFLLFLCHKSGIVL